MLLEDLQVVLKVAEMRSITAAAAQLDMRVATASAALKRVEVILGAELFVRTTRKLRLSNLGERYIPQCEQALGILAQAKQSLKGDEGIVDGELRIALSSDLGRNLVIPWLDEFMDKYPGVSLKMTISDSVTDFYRDQVDIALRYGSPTDSNHYGFKICDAPGLLVASKGYLDLYGMPKQPQDLTSHNGLFYQLYDVIYDNWKFTRDGAECKIKMRGNRASNDGDLVRRWCVAGKGVAIKSCLDMANDLLTGKVVNVMPEYKPKQTGLWLVCPSRQSITPAVRLLRDTFREKSSEILKQLINEKILDEPTIK